MSPDRRGFFAIVHFARWYLDRQDLSMSSAFCTMIHFVKQSKIFGLTNQSCPGMFESLPRSQLLTIKR